jgi:hypothetical protein
MTQREFKVGDRIRFDTHSNLGIREDVVRAKFTQTITLEPYARNVTAPALVLTEHSWCLESDVVTQQRIFLVAYTDDEGPYAVAFSTRELADAFAATFSDRQDNRGGCTVIDSFVDQAGALVEVVR